MKRFTIFALICAMMFSIICLPATAINTENFFDDEKVNICDTVTAPQALKENVIVVVPGITGSELKCGTKKVWVPTASTILNFSDLACYETGESIKSITPITPQSTNDNYGALDTYRGLYEALNNTFSNVADVKFFAYDWRLSCKASATSLKNLISSYTGEIVIVAHSMGGLVGSELIRQESVSQRKRTTLITIGTPFTGAPKAIGMMENGQMGFVPIELVDSLAGLFINNYAQNFPAIYELLPTSRSQSFITVPGAGGKLSYTDSVTLLKSLEWAKKANGAVKPMFAQAQTFMNGINNSSGNHYAYMGRAAYHIVATGKDTTNEVIYKKNSDGSYTYSAIGYNNSGDGTVPLLSATNGLSTGDNRVTSYSTVGDHTGMVSNSTVHAKVKSIISSLFNTKTSMVYDVDGATISEPQIVVNNRGWLIDPEIDGHRININVNGLQDHRLLMANNQDILCEGDSLFYYDNNGNRVSIGSRWETGIGVQYALLNGEYKI